MNSPLATNCPKDRHEGPKHVNKSFFTFGANGKSPSSTYDSQQSPLLANHSNKQNDEENPITSAQDSPPSRFQRATRLLRSGLAWITAHLLIIILSCILAIGTVSVCVYGVIHHHGPADTPAAICTTPGCVLAASEILHNISPRYREIDPCTDFRSYVCEGWDLRHDLRADQSSVFTGTIMNEDSQILLRHVLEAPYPKPDTTSAETGAIDEKNFIKLQDAYNACLDEGQIKSKKSGPLIKMLRKLEEMFPVNNPGRPRDSYSGSTNQRQKGLSYTEENPLSKALAYLMGIGVEAMVSMEVAADDRDPDSTIISITAPRSPGLPSKQYYNNDTLVKAYGNTIGLVLESLLEEATPNSTLFGIWQSLRSSKTGLSINNDALVESLLEFESRLAAATPDSEDAEDVTKYYNPRTLEETNTYIPQIKIQYLISSRTPDYSPPKIIVGSPSYLKTLSETLKSTSKETLQAYLVWKAVQEYGNRVESDALKPLLRFNNLLQGKDPEVVEERWRTCVKHVDQGLGWLLSRFYIEKAFSKVAKDFGDRIVSDIKNQFIKKLQASEWMSPDVQKLGVDKVHNIVQKIGYPTKSPDITDPEVLQNFYSSVNVSRTTYFDNWLSMIQADVTREWAKLGKPTDRDEWGMTAPTVNAYYNPAGNEIVFPAGIMQSPVFYPPSIPQYLSYGAFGAVSGHELSHAFDSTGRHYDQKGNYTNWWDNSTVEAFKEKTQCFVEQYHNYTVPGLDGKPLHINGKLTLGENIADAGGLTASFQAWKEREAANPSQLLPGLQDFTKEQLYFVSYANWWCGKTRPEQQVNGIYRDPHSPLFARILGTTANSREFRQSFNCPQKEPTCELW